MEYRITRDNVGRIVELERHNDEETTYILVQQIIAEYNSILEQLNDVSSWSATVLKVCVENGYDVKYSSPLYIWLRGHFEYHRDKIRNLTQQLDKSKLDLKDLQDLYAKEIQEDSCGNSVWGNVPKLMDERDRLKNGLVRLQKEFDEYRLQARSEDDPCCDICDGLSEENEGLRRDLKEWEEIGEDVVGKLEAIKKICDDLREDNSRLREANGSLTNAVDEWKKTYYALRRDYDSKLNKIGELEKSKGVPDCSVEEYLRDQNEEIRVLKDKLKDTTRLVRSMEATNSRLVIDLQKKDAQIKGLRKWLVYIYETASSRVHLHSWLKELKSALDGGLAPDDYETKRVFKNDGQD